MYAGLLASPLAESVVYDHPGEASVNVTGIWSEDDAAMPQGIQATLFCLAASVPEVEKRDTITRGSKIYRVTDWTRDGTGGITLALKYVETIP